MNKSLFKMFSVITMLALMIGGMPMQSAQAARTELFFSEYVEGSSFNKAVEIYNGTGVSVDLSTYSVQLYSNGSSSASQSATLSGTLADGDVFVLAHASADSAILAVADATNSNVINFNGDDAVVLRKGTTIIDVIGQIGFRPSLEWGSGLTSTLDNTLRRKDAITAGDTDGSDVFDPSIEWNGFANNTFFGLGWHLVSPVITSCGGSLNTLLGNSASRLVTAFDGDGTVIDIAITSVTPSPAPGTISLTGLVAAGSVGGTASATVTVDSSVPTGTYSVLVTATNNDPTPVTGTCTLTVNVLSVQPIGTVQGAVNDTDDGLLVRSPFAPPSSNNAGTTFVAVQGVIYQKTLARTSAGLSQNGIFIQNTTATDDNDPNTSDGIFVFMGSFTTLLRASGGTYTPQIGDEIIVAGRVSEFFNLTQLSSSLSVFQVVRSGVDLNAELPAFDVNPPDDLADANRYWERREGMRAQVPAGSLVIDSRDVFASTADGEFWVVRGDHPIAQRPDPYARRAFRDPHPLDDDPELFDNGNGYRIILGSLGVKATAGNNSVLIAPARTYDTMTNAPVGGVYFSFSKYQIMVQQQPILEEGVDPALNAPPQSFDRDQEFSIAPYNVENLYDRRDDPFDGCDFTGNTGCPGVNPPFDYVPASQAIYDAHLNDIAEQIVTDLHGPDIIFVQEAEDQDICTVTAGALDCDLTLNNTKFDGKPDTLQELALRIAALENGPAYDAVYDRNGADDRGIVSGFLYRSDRVELLPASASDPVLGSTPTVDYRGTPLAYNANVQNPKALNADLPDDVDLSSGVDGSNVFTRPPQVGLFRIWRDTVGSSAFVDLYALSNHFSSTPNARVGQRTEQALYDAAIVAALQAANPDVVVAVAGDFNVYPRPDDPFAPGDLLFPSDQLGPLYEQGLENLFDVLVTQVPASAYSYIFQGQTQTLDQIFVTPSLIRDLVQARAAHVNSDWPADYDGDGARGASDHDPLVARYKALTPNAIAALVQYYEDHGLITGNNTADKLIDRLLKARRFYEAGQNDAYQDQLQAFIDQIYDFTPQFIAQEAADILTSEAALLKSLP